MKKKYESINDGEFVSKYMVLLEKFSNNIEEMFGTCYSDHTLVRLCEDLWDFKPEQLKIIEEVK